MASFFQTPKPKSYKVEPRYWNPEKEEREKRERRIKAELGLGQEDGTYRPYIGKGDFRLGMSKGKWSATTQRRRSNTRLLLFVVLLALVVYFLLK
jgi:hypothetical protein